MLPSVTRHHIFWLVVIIIAICYLLAPYSEVTHILRVFFHIALTFLLNLLG